ncbi:hypothetical protein [Pseudofrankia sp. BMG5.37]|uniref:hypothetical protein n=1 Tax=Pseudofrankia sp. BMG5.37 TaxID=3050035 RepID=UPI0028951192|nr:hypothetical protein [Pseudofrankia sp. BMG5.37]MDT3443573.1 hypothetical protein [Pseudofrankia sp. BMG5.37]
MEEFALQWKIGHTGTAADLIMTASGRTVTVHTTYLGDGLGELVRSALDLLRGSRSSIALLLSEPGGTWLFFTDSRHHVFLQLVEFPNVWSESLWAGGSLVWSGRIGVNQYAYESLKIAEGALEYYGDAEFYLAKWGARFPAEEVSEVRDLLRAA